MSDLRKLLLLLGGLTLLRCLWAVQMPLIAGEAYYWLWNWHPAAGYFDHPPMVGLAGLLLGGRILDSTLAARLPAILLGALSTLAFYGLGRSMFPDGRTAWRAAALFALTPIFDLNAMFLSPDNTLVLFTTLTWLAFWRAAERPAEQGRWLAAGTVGGLALLCKFHAWVLLPPLYLFLLLARDRRPILRRVGPWLALAVSLLVLSPNLVWNARHDWLNYAFQWRRSDLPESHFKWEHIFHYIAGPLATLSPLLYAAVLGAVWRGWKVWRATREARWLYLLCAGVPLPLFLGLLTPLTGISLHWPAPAYGALILLAVALIENGCLFGPRFFRPAFALAIAFTALIHLAPLLALHLPDSTAYPWHPYLARTHRYRKHFVGWPEIGERVRRERQAMLDADPAVPVVLMAKNWHLTSLLAFYARLPDEACPLVAADLHNYQLWIAPRGGLAGASAVVVIDKEEPMFRHSRLLKKYDEYHRRLDPLFESVREQPSLIVYEDGTIAEYFGVEVQPPRLREFLIFRCTRFKGRFIGDGVSK